MPSSTCKRAGESKTNNFLGVITSVPIPSFYQDPGSPPTPKYQRLCDKSLYQWPARLSGNLPAISHVSSKELFVPIRVLLLHVQLFVHFCRKIPARRQQSRSASCSSYLNWLSNVPSQHSQRLNPDWLLDLSCYQYANRQNAYNPSFALFLPPFPLPQWRWKKEPSEFSIRSSFSLGCHNRKQRTQKVHIPW